MRRRRKRKTIEREREREIKVCRLQLLWLNWKGGRDFGAAAKSFSKKGFLEIDLYSFVVNTFASKH
jgi:hypothetical protein